MDVAKVSFFFFFWIIEPRNSGHVENVRGTFFAFEHLLLDPSLLRVFEKIEVVKKLRINTLLTEYYTLRCV